MANKYDIFISYRRSTGAQYARILQLMLTQRGYKVFLDYDELTDGKFGEHIQEAIKEARIFMLVLSKEALARCKNEGDWVRREIHLAIAEGKHIIPVNPDKSFDGIPDDIPDDIKEEVSTHQHSDINFGQTLGITVDFMVANRIEPQIGKRIRQDSDPDVLNQLLKAEDKARRKHRLFIKSIITSGVLCIIAIIGTYINEKRKNNDYELKRKNLMAQVESHHDCLNLMANDSISIEQLEVLDEIFNNLRPVYGDSIKFSAYETTVKEYNTILGNDYDRTKSSLPVNEVSFGRALQFIDKLNEIINSDATNIMFSLPNEEEWEYAASGGDLDNVSLYSGSSNIEEVAWYADNSGGVPHLADGQNEHKPNIYGLYDMSGNVYEHVFTPFIDFSHPEAFTNMMLIKGGSYMSRENECTIEHSVPLEADLSSPRVGFRLVLRKK